MRAFWCRWRRPIRCSGFEPAPGSMSLSRTRSGRKLINWEKMLLPSFIPHLGWFYLPRVSNRGKEKPSVKDISKRTYATDRAFPPDTSDNTSTLPQGRFVVGRQSYLPAAQTVRGEGAPPKIPGSIHQLLWPIDSAVQIADSTPLCDTDLECHRARAWSWEQCRFGPPPPPDCRRCIKMRGHRLQRP